MSIKLCSVIYYSTQLSDGKQHALNELSFISHLAHVASILEEFGQSKNTIAASFLRDLNLSDDHELVEECKQSINEEVQNIINIFSTKTIQEIAKYAKTDVAHRSAALIILADIWSTLTLIEHIQEERVEEFKIYSLKTVDTLSGIDSRFDYFIYQLLE